MVRGTHAAMTSGCRRSGPAVLLAVLAVLLGGAVVLLGSGPADGSAGWSANAAHGLSGAGEHPVTAGVLVHHGWVAAGGEQHTSHGGASSLPTPAWLSRHQHPGRAITSEPEQTPSLPHLASRPGRAPPPVSGT
ncbi:hypothetical protein [Streptomyces sp. TP-A0874]|uniref:hypothetical protein n=1 Tax=Streptomyces sp. TP-A0874 TaxID=549819 RepID=UPI0008530D9B|nr:hypothetical protein [Streptomyces sp. TP-A0874]